MRDDQDYGYGAEELQPDLSKAQKGRFLILATVVCWAVVAALLWVVL